MPPGLTYLPEFVSEPDEETLIAQVESLPFREVRMHGVVAKRTVVHFGYDYDYDGWKIVPTDPPPAWLEPLIARGAEAAGIGREQLAQFLIARYPPGAAIGWHRDAPMFGSTVIGVSLGSDCVMRFRRKTADGFETENQPLAARSLYILAGAARSQWQHSIRPTKSLRYSITMRTLRSAQRPSLARNVQMR